MKNKSRFHYPLRLDGKDGAAVSEVVKESGQSINSVLALSIRKGLPLARQALARSVGRVTTVDPLPDDVLDRAYAVPDELSRVSARQLATFQVQEEPE